MMTYDDYRLAMEYFAYHGFCPYTEPETAGKTVASAIRGDSLRARMVLTLSSSDTQPSCQSDHRYLKSEHLLLLSVWPVGNRKGCLCMVACITHMSLKTTLLRTLAESGAQMYKTDKAQLQALGAVGDRFLFVRALLSMQLC